MASKYWFKVYVEVLDDPKVALLPDRLWRRFFECLALAKDHGNNGQLPPVDHIEWRLRTENIKEELDALVTHGLLTVTDGRYTVRKFEDRQRKNDAAERMREYRKRKRYKVVTQALPHGDEKPIEEEEELEVDLEEEEDDDESSSPSNILDLAITLGKITKTTRGKEFESTLDLLEEAGMTEGRLLAWYADKQRGWPSVRPSNAERPDPWLSQVAKHAVCYVTDGEKYVSGEYAEFVES